MSFSSRKPARAGGRWIGCWAAWAAGVVATLASSTQTTFDWLNVAAGRGKESIAAVVLDTGDQSFVAGSFSEVLQVNDDLLFSVADSDVFVAKTASTGQVLWLATLAGGFNDFSQGVVPDGLGGCLVSWGNSLSRLDENGQQQWTRNFLETLGTFGVVRESTTRAVVLVRENEDQYTLRRVELSEGEDQWTKPLGVTASAGRLARDESGNLFAAWIARGEVRVEDQLFRLPPGGDAVVVVMKFNAEGALQWTRFAEGAQTMGLNAFKTTPAGELVLGGTASGPFTLGGVQIGRTNGVAQGWVLVLDPNGACRWQLGNQGIEVTAAGPLGTNEVVYARNQLTGGTQMLRYNLTNDVDWTVFGGAVRVADLAARTNGSVWVTGRYQGDGGLGTKPFIPPIIGDDGLFFGRRALIKPLILLDPMSTTNVAGNFVRLQPEIDDADSRVWYQWSKKGVRIPGATNATLDFPAVTLADAGDYTVAITNVDGGTNSAVATLKVVLALTTEVVGEGAVVADPADPIFEPGRTVELLAVAQDGHEFTGWSGDVAGLNPLANPLTFPMNSNRTVRATFVQIPRLVGASGPDGSSVFRLEGPAGAAAELQVSEDLKTWRRILALRLSEVPAEVGNLGPVGARTFYRLMLK